VETPAIGAGRGGTHEDDPNEPIKLLEVNAATLSTGSVEPFGFTPTQSVPFRTVIAEVTPEEFERIRKNEIGLPQDGLREAGEGLSSEGHQRSSRRPREKPRGFREVPERAEQGANTGSTDGGDNGPADM